MGVCGGEEKQHLTDLLHPTPSHSIAPHRTRTASPPVAGSKEKGFNKGTRVTQVSVGFGTLVVGVSTGPGMSELHVIDLEGDDSDDSHLYTRHTAAVRGNISLIVQGARLIAVACAQHGVSLFDYELKPVAGASPLRFQGSGPGAGARQSYGRNTLSVNGTTCALVRSQSPREVLLFSNFPREGGVRRVAA